MPPKIKKKASNTVKDKEGNCQGSTHDKIKVIEQYFKETLAPEDVEDEYLKAPPPIRDEKELFLL